MLILRTFLIVRAVAVGLYLALLPGVALADPCFERLSSVLQVVKDPQKAAETIQGESDCSVVDATTTTAGTGVAIGVGAGFTWIVLRKPGGGDPTRIKVQGQVPTGSTVSVREGPGGTQRVVIEGTHGGKGVIDFPGSGDPPTGKVTIVQPGEKLPAWPKPPGTLPGAGPTAEPVTAGPPAPATGGPTTLPGGGVTPTIEAPGGGPPATSPTRDLITDRPPPGPPPSTGSGPPQGPPPNPFDSNAGTEVDWRGTPSSGGIIYPNGPDAGANKALVDATRDPSDLVKFKDPKTGKETTYVKPPGSTPTGFDGIGFQHAGLDPKTGQITRFDSPIKPEDIANKGLTPIVDPDNVTLVGRVPAAPPAAPPPAAPPSPASLGPTPAQPSAQKAADDLSKVPPRVLPGEPPWKRPGAPPPVETVSEPDGGQPTPPTSGPPPRLLPGEPPWQRPGAPPPVETVSQPDRIPPSAPPASQSPAPASPAAPEPPPPPPPTPSKAFTDSMQKPGETVFNLGDAGLTNRDGRIQAPPAVGSIRTNLQQLEGSTPTIERDPQTGDALVRVDTGNTGDAIFKLSVDKVGENQRIKVDLVENRGMANTQVDAAKAVIAGQVNQPIPATVDVKTVEPVASKPGGPVDSLKVVKEPKPTR